MITIHHLENSRSQRVIWLAQALGLDFKVIRYERDSTTQLAPKELFKIHPLGKSPVISDGDLVIAESGAIFEYLLEKYDTEFKLHPNRSSALYKDYLFWLHFGEGSLMGPLLMSHIHSTVIQKVPFFIKPIAKLIFAGIGKAYLYKQIETLFSFMENHFSKDDYFLNNQFSAIDIFLSFPLETAMSGRIDKKKYLKLKLFVDRMKNREDYKKAIEVGGPYIY